MSYNSKYTGEEVESMLDSIESKQDVLVSGTSIKTINGESILGSGNINISGGGITTETDPIFLASPAASITEAKKAEWDAKQDKASRNLIINSNFDNGGIISNNLPWTHKALGGSSTLDSIHTGYYNGYNAAQLQYVIYGQPVILEEGKTYTLSCMYISDGSTNSYLDYNNLLGEKNIIDGYNVLIDPSGIRLNSCTTYTKAYVTFSVSQTSERVLAIGNTDTSGHGGLFISCIQLEEGSVATEYKRAEETYITTSILKDALNKPILEAPYNDTVAGFIGDDAMKHGVIYVSRATDLDTTITIENFEAPDKDVVEYVWHFQTGTMPTLSLPSYIHWANGELPEIEDNTVYELSITATRHNPTFDYIYKAVLVPFKTI